MTNAAPIRARPLEEAQVVEQRAAAHGSHAASGALPPALTTFIGRRSELQELQSLAGRTRLLTLVGGGGAGKTRLAVELAELLRAKHPQGAWFVDLSGVTDADQVELAVARAVGTIDDRQAAPLDTVVARLQGEPGLLVVDNCEHLVETCAAVVVTLLMRCAHLRVLATSREPLDVSGETTWRVPALSLPPVDPVDVTALAGSEAVDLFCDRAKHARPDWVCTDDEAGAVASICLALEGMPLALELAAARVRVLSVAGIAAGLCDQLGLLTGGGRLAAQRRRTLRASLDWSHELLTDPERNLFRRLAAFTGTFDVPAAAVVGATPSDLMEHQVLDQLCLLVDKSLVTALPGPDGSTRFRLPETVRQYAAQQLAASGEREVVAAAHRAHYLALAEALRDRAHGSDTQPVLAALANELSNLRVAFDGSLSAGEVDQALRLATACYPLWRMSGRRAEGSAWLDRALAGGETDARVRLRALIARNRLAGAGGICGAEADRVDEAIALAREVGDRGLLARALHGGTAYLVRGPRALQRLLAESLQVASEAGDSEAALDAEMWLALSTTFLHPERAVVLLDELAARTEHGSADYLRLAAAGWSGVARLMCGDADGARHTLDTTTPPEAAVAAVMHGYLLACSDGPTRWPRTPTKLPNTWRGQHGSPRPAGTGSSTPCWGWLPA